MSLDAVKKYLKIVCEGGPTAEYFTEVFLLNALPSKIQEQVTLQIGIDLT